MIDRETLIAELIRDEGERLNVYDDDSGAPIKPGSIVKGHPTIGIGRALDVRGISASEAQFLLRNDIDAFSLGCAQAFTWWGGLDPVRQRALINMAFNLGIDGLRRFPKAMGFVAAKNWESAAFELENSDWYRQVGSRAARIVAVIRTGAAA